MKVLLDECLPKKLKRDFIGYDKNGALLGLAAPTFDVFVTIDNNWQYQQNLQTIQLVIIVLNAKDNKLETLRPLISTEP
jgi:hypothetical protein